MDTIATAAEQAAFRAFQRGTSHVVMLLAQDGSVRWVSPSVENVLGYDPEKFQEIHPLSLVHPDDAAFVGEVLEAADRNLDGRLHQGDSRLAFDVRVQHRSGHWVTLEVLSNNLLGTPGINGRLLIARDITVRRALDDALTAVAESFGYEQAIRKVLHFLEICMVGTVAAFWWPGQEPTWISEHVPTELLTVDGPWRRLPDDGRLLILGDLEQALEDGRVEHGLAREALDAGFRACWCIGVPRPDRKDSWGGRRRGAGGGDMPTGTFVIWSCVDTEPLLGYTVAVDRAATLAQLAMIRSEVERQREAQLERQRVQNEQLAEISALRTDLILTMSHDLRTPLTAISGAAAMLGEEEDTTQEDREEFLDIIEHNTNRLLHMVDDLLLLAQLDAEGLHPVRVPLDLASVTTAAVESIRPAARAKGVQLELRAVGGPDLTGDPDQLRHLADNLVSNAVKYTPPGGRIAVEVCPTEDAWQLIVTDTGIGIPTGELEQVFDRFARGSNARAAQIAGSGLGLVIAQAVARSHGGDISVDSREGRGSRFVVTLRCAASPVGGR